MKKKDFEVSFFEGLFKPPKAKHAPNNSGIPDLEAQWPFSVNNKVNGLIVYMLAYSYLLGGDKDSAITMCNILKNIDSNLARHLYSLIFSKRPNP